MNNHAELIAEVRRHWEHWSGHLGLTNWWIDISMMDAGEQVKDATSGLTMAYHRHEYMRGYLRINPDQSECVFPLSLTVLHEACHLKYSGISDLALSSCAPDYSAAWERTIETECDETAMIIWRLHALTDCHE